VAFVTLYAGIHMKFLNIFFALNFDSINQFNESVAMREVFFITCEL